MSKLVLAFSGFWVLAVLSALRLRGVYLRQPGGEDEVNAVGVLSGARAESASKQFSGGYLRAVLGGASLNLSAADTGLRPAVIETTIILGGAELEVPRGWKVRVDLSPVLGGVADSRLQPSEGDGRQPDLVLTGTLVLGGLSITERTGS